MLVTVSLCTTNRLTTSLTQVKSKPNQSLLRPWTQKPKNHQPFTSTTNTSPHNIDNPFPHHDHRHLVGTRLDNWQLRQPITHETMDRPNADKCRTHDHAWCGLLLTWSRTPPIYLSFSVIWPSFPLLCNKGIFYFWFLFTCINYGSHFCAMKIPCSCLISSPLVLVA